MAKVILDPGHGGTDIGDYYGRRSEKDDNLVLALKVGKLLRDRGVEVEYTRTTDRYLPMLKRVDAANKIGGDLLVSIHRSMEPTFNRYPSMDFYVGEDDPVAVEAAENIRDSLSPVGFRNYHLITRTDLSLLNDTDMPSLMLAIGYFRSDEANRYYDEHLDEIAKGIADGIYQTLMQTGAAEIQEAGMQAGEGARTEYRYCILTGYYPSYEVAEEHRKRLDSMGCSNIRISGETDHYRIYAGEFTELDRAAEWELFLRRCGYYAMVVCIEL